MADLRQRIERLLNRLLPEPAGSEAALAAGRARDFFNDRQIDLYLVFDDLVGAAWQQPLGDDFWREVEALGAELQLPRSSGLVEPCMAAAERWDFCEGYGFVWRGQDRRVGIKARDGYNRPLQIDAACARALATRLEALAAWAAGGSGGVSTGRVEVEPAPGGLRLVLHPGARLYLDAHAAAQLAEDLRAKADAGATQLVSDAAAAAPSVPSESSARAYLRAGRVLDAVREYRTLTGVDLKTAHAAIERWARESPDAGTPPGRTES